MSESTKAKLGEWANPQFLTTVLSMVVAIVLAYGKLDSRIGGVEAAQTAARADVEALKADSAEQKRLRAGDRELLVRIESKVENVQEKVEKLAEKKP